MAAKLRHVVYLEHRGAGLTVFSTYTQAKEQAAGG